LDDIKEFSKFQQQKLI